jgi:TrkA domain protein
MAVISEVDLPGVGRKYEITTYERDRFTIVIHHSGIREIYIYRDGETEPLFAVELRDDEARQIGSILAGAFFRPKVVENVDVVLRELCIEWFRLDARSPVVGKSIGELEIRKRTGVSVIAILREPENVPNPSAEEILRAGDTIVVLGKPEGFDALRRLIEATP